MSGYLELGQHVLRHLEALGEDLPVHIHGDVPVAEHGLVRDVHGAGPHPARGEDARPVAHQVAGAVAEADVDAPGHGGLELGREDHGAELHGVARLVDRLVCLDEDGVTLGSGVTSHITHMTRDT